MKLRNASDDDFGSHGAHGRDKSCWPAAGASNQVDRRDHLRARMHATTSAARKKCSAGALQLAAIVHYDSLASYRRRRHYYYYYYYTCPPPPPPPLSSCVPLNCTNYNDNIGNSENKNNGANNKSHAALAHLDRSPPSESGECADPASERVVVLEDTHDESRAAGQREKEPKSRQEEEEEEEAKRGRRNKSGNKFSRLFFGAGPKSKQSKQLAACAMIDSTNSPEQEARETRDAAARRFAQADGPHSTHLREEVQEGKAGGVRRLQEKIDIMQQQQQQQQRETTRARKRVIEFKFDLIVEGAQDQGAEDDQEDDDNCDELRARERRAKIRAPIEQSERLLEQVRELVESFALDAADVCLMSVGRAPLNSFEYLLQSAELTLTHAFGLLAATSSGGGGGGSGSSSGAEMRTPSRRPADDRNTPCSPLRIDARPLIALEALLIVERHQGHRDGQVAPVDVDGPGALEVFDLLGAALGTGASRDCSSDQEALARLRQVEAQLDLELSKLPAASAATSLMINLTLKQQVQGGLFTNRMCLLDLGARVKSSKLRPVLESIFSGQALAYLKGQKVLLQELSEQLANDAGAEPSVPPAHDDQQAAQTRNKSPSKHEKHCHHIASHCRRLAELAQVEWLIYKRLSSALIRSLVVVHCCRLTPADTEMRPQRRRQGDNNKNEPADDARPSRATIESHLMEYNLSLLDFASSIKRAASSRLKRRKRHLRSHLNADLTSAVTTASTATNTMSGRHTNNNATTSSNLSLASDTLTTSHNCKSYRSSPGERLPDAERHSSKDLIISNTSLWPGSAAQTRRASRSSRHHSCDCDDEQPQASRFPAVQPHLLAGYSRTTASSHREHRRHHRHHRYDHHSYNHHYHHRHPHQGHRRHRRQQDHHDARACADACRYPQPSRAASLNRRCSRDLCAGLDELETSSQLSTTSSGASQRTASASRLRSLLIDAQSHHSQQGSGGAGSVAQDSGRWPAASSVASWAARARLQLQRQILDQSSPSEPSTTTANTLDDSIELQSFSSSSGIATCVALSSTAPLDVVATSTEEALQAQASGSEVCPPLVAEPPRQLKLEQFLNQLSNFIGPASSDQGAQDDGESSSAAQESDVLRAHRAVKMTQDDVDDDDDEDEDEDCRSHSSILDHLSSLTLEANLKMVKQHQHQQQSDEPRVSIVSEDVTSGSGCGAMRWLPPESTNGHLQQLLKSTLKLQQQRGQLTIDCGAPCAGPHKSSGPHNSLTDSPRQATDGFTPPTSIESTCSSTSSSSASSSSSERALARAVDSSSSFSTSGVPEHHVNMSQLYASVIKQQI